MRKLLSNPYLLLFIPAAIGAIIIVSAVDAWAVRFAWAAVLAFASYGIGSVLAD